jgi:hypothetical protein
MDLSSFIKQKLKIEISHQEMRDNQPIGKSVLSSHSQFTLPVHTPSLKMSSQCQAITLKGAQCKRKVSTNCKFCKQHSEFVDPSPVPAPQPERISNVVHGPRAFIAQIPVFEEQQPHPEDMCTFKNVCGEYICTKSKIENCRFCEEHQNLFNTHEWFVEIHSHNFVKENRSYLIFFDRHIRTTLYFFNQMANISHEFIQFSNTQGCNKIKNLHEEWNREKFLNIAKGPYHNLTENFFNFRFSDDLKQLTSLGKFFNIDARISHEKNKVKLEKMKVNLLNEIFMKDPHTESNKLQSVFSKDICRLVNNFI